MDKTLSSLKDAYEAEEEKEKNLLDEARPISEYYRNFGSAAANKLSAPLQGVWKGPICDLQVKVEGDNFSAVGKYYPSVGLLAALAAETEGQRKDTKSVPARTVEYNGHIEGRTITGTVSRASEDSSRISTILTDGPHPAVLMWVSHDCRVIHALERGSSGKPLFFTLTQ